MVIHCKSHYHQWLFCIYLSLYCHD
ncbi:protein of unknown function [Candidatus Methylocalor cossyra]|uniref:Uncharacterized protein n=1 Tax=Candidatus Methylocalor cossyra TaxID=3108543 RepID=A0ABP1C8M4_9GAMM